MNEKELIKKYIDKYEYHVLLYNLMLDEGMDAYQAIKHCYFVEVGIRGGKLAVELTDDKQMQKEFIREIVDPFSEAMLSLEELAEIDYDVVEEEMKTEMKKILNGDSYV